MGPKGPLLANEIEIGFTIELHAVAPGGPPEGQCEKEKEMVNNRTSRPLPYREASRWQFYDSVTIRDKLWTVYQVITVSNQLQE